MLPGETARPNRAYDRDMTLQLPPPTPMPDPNLLAMHVFELLTVVVVGTVAALIVRWVVQSPIGQAIGERIRRRKGAGDLTREQEDRVARLEGELQALRGELGEFAERLDFAERVLAERRERRLGAGQ